MLSRLVLYDPFGVLLVYGAKPIPNLFALWGGPLRDKGLSKDGLD